MYVCMLLRYSFVCHYSRAYVYAIKSLTLGNWNWPLVYNFSLAISASAELLVGCCSLSLPSFGRKYSKMWAAFVIDSFAQKFMNELFFRPVFWFFSKICQWRFMCVCMLSWLCWPLSAWNHMTTRMRAHCMRI